MSCQSIDNVSKKINSSFNYSNVSCQIKWGYLSSLLPITFIDIFVLCTSTKTFRWNLKTLIDDFGFFMVMVLDLITHTWICFESGKRLFHFFSCPSSCFSQISFTYYCSWNGNLLSSYLNYHGTFKNQMNI